MNSFLRLLCLTLLSAAVLANGAFAQTSAYAPAPSEAAVMPPAAPAEQSGLQLRSNLVPAVLPTATVLRLKLDRPISTASARPGQQFTATLARPVDVNGRTVISAGSSVNCRVDGAHGARRFAGKPSLSIKAISVHTPSGEQLNFTASVVDTSNPQHLDVNQEGAVRGVTPNPMNKVEMGSLTGVGAIAGAVIAGPEGLLIGTAGGAVVAAGHMVIKHHDLTLPAGTELIFELDAPSSTTHPQTGGV
jgi:hypothetical protein